jgi:hypothetical protein
LRWVVSARRSRLVGNGVDLTRFQPDWHGRAKVRQELGLADSDLLVGGVGRRVAEKGIAEFAQRRGRSPAKHASCGWDPTTQTSRMQ